MVPRTQTQVPDKNKNIEVIMRVDRRFQPDILTDSTASLVTEGLLGNRYVNITRGFTGVTLKEGQEVPGTEEKAIKEVVERSSDLLGNFQALTLSVQDLVAGVKQGKGNLGKLLTDEQAYNNLNALLAKSNKMVSGIREGQGTLGKLVATDEMYNKVGAAVDNVNSIMGGCPRAERHPRQAALRSGPLRSGEGSHRQRQRRDWRRSGREGDPRQTHHRRRSLQ